MRNSLKLLFWRLSLRRGRRREQAGREQVVGLHEDKEAAMTGEDWLQVMVKRIVTQFAPERVILFGSQARGNAGPFSDVDLLVVLDNVKDRRQEAIRIRQALADLPVAKDVFVTTPEEIRVRGNLVGSVLRPALREGKVLYERT